MSTHASIWTPRHTHKLWPRPKQKYVHKATPYVAPPPPPPLKKPPPPEELHTSADELAELEEGLLSEAEKLEANKPSPSVRIQLGIYLLEKDDAIKSVLKAWDSKGKGEFLKGEFRLNLRTTGIQATSAEADELFDSWDECATTLRPASALTAAGAASTSQALAMRAATPRTAHVRRCPPCAPS